MALLGEQLFHAPKGGSFSDDDTDVYQTEQVTHLAQPLDVSHAISVRLLHELLESYYGSGASLVVRRDGNTLTKRDVLRHCTQHLEDFIVPKHVEFRSELPKTTSGKIKKTGLR